jgi:predicted Ser/Thr protein kinase
VSAADDGQGTPPPTRQVGKYEVKQILGGGGQAVTYKAWDPDAKRHVVLKVYHAARDVDALLKEGQALARVRSPYVAQCFAVDRHEGVPYLVIEYIPGRSLADVVRDGPPDPVRSLKWVAQAAEGLAAVHACGLLHLDLKPANVLIGDDDKPRLVDFGLARPVGDALKDICGTLAYMPPEQARGDADRIDPRTDIFGLGTVLYHLLTGTPPYRGQATQEVWQQACAGEVEPPRARSSRVSGPVNDLCMRCLARDPTLRFASAAELAAAVRRLLWWQRWRWRVVGAVAALVALAVGLGVWAGPRSHSPAGGDTPVVDEMPRDTDGRPLRRDFPIQVQLSTARKDPSGPLYRMTEGQLLVLQLEVPVTSYVGVWYEDEEGTIRQLFPDKKHEPDHRVEAGKPRLIPQGYKLRARPGAAPGLLRVLASTEWWDPWKGQKDGPLVVFATKEEVAQFRDFVIEARSKAISEYIFPVKIDPR